MEDGGSGGPRISQKDDLTAGRSAPRGIDGFVRENWERLAMAAMAAVLIWVLFPTAIASVAGGAWAVVQPYTWEISMAFAAAGVVWGLDLVNVIPNALSKANDRIVGALSRGETTSGDAKLTTKESQEKSKGLTNVRTLLMLAGSGLIAAAAVYVTFFTTAVAFQLTQVASFIAMIVIGLSFIPIVDVTILRDFDSFDELHNRNTAFGRFYLAVAIIILAAAIGSS